MRDTKKKPAKMEDPFRGWFVPPQDPVPSAPESNPECSPAWWETLVERVHLDAPEAIPDLLAAIQRQEDGWRQAVGYWRGIAEAGTKVIEEVEGLAKEWEKKAEYDRRVEGDNIVIRCGLHAATCRGAAMAREVDIRDLRAALSSGTPEGDDRG